MQNEKKYFLSTDSMLDADSADFVVPQNAWVNMQNARTGTTDAGVVGTVESIGSTELIKENNDYIAIGMADDVENKRFVTFYYYNGTDKNLSDKIECCYTDTNTVYTVLNSFDVYGMLKFTLEPIHSAKITNNILSWVDGTNNEPRKINIESGMAAYDPTFQTQANPYILPLDFSEITLIKRPPIYTPNIQKEYNDAFKNNFIANESFQFAFQYVYYDNETSVTSAYSQASKLNFETDNFNYVRVLMDNFEKIPSTVKVVNLIVRIGNGKPTGSNNSFIVKTWDKETPSENTDIVNHNAGIISLQYNFYNNTTGEFLAEDDTLRQFDNVPIYSLSHEVTKNRFFLGNNTVGYNPPRESSLSLVYNITETNQPSSQETLLYLELRTIASISQSGFISYLYYKAYYINTTVTINGVTRQGFYEISFTVKTSAQYISPPPTTIQRTALLFRGNTLSDVIQSVKQGRRWNTVDYQNFITNYITGSQTTSGINFTQFVLLSNAVVNLGDRYSVFPQLSSYNVGIVFYDYAMRRCSVVPYSKSSYQPIYLYSSTILNTAAPNIINFTSQLPTSLWGVGDFIEITDSTGINGTYTILSISSTYVEVNASLTTTNTQNGTVRILRLVEGGVTTASRDFSQSYAMTSITWSLNQQGAVTEIPDWAYYYSVVMTLNLTKRFFVQGYSDDLKYVGRDASGAYTLYSSTYSTGRTVGIGINVQLLQRQGLGYDFTEGDQAILTFYDKVLRLPIIAQEGNYVIVKAINIGVITPNYQYTIVYEFYTPYQQSTQEPYYEIGEIYKINNPKTLNREYSILTNVIQGDTYLRNRFPNSNYSYKANIMSPNDRFWQRWDTDAGKINFVTKLGRAKNITQILWSDTIVSGTKINGSSTFRIGNDTYVPTDCGAISKLILTSKIQEQGTVMLSICTNETNSMYLGETQITDSTGKVQFFGANASQVISTINTLKGSFGTVNPEAVTEFRGSVFYPDANRGVWVQYSSNGLFPISNYKMTRFWKLFFQRYLSADGQQYMANNNIRPYLFSAVDASHLELLISLPQIYDTPPKGYLVDFPNEIYPFDIYDGVGKSVVFCLENTGVQPHWQGSYSFNPEQFMCLQNKLYSVKDGNLYQHNMTSSFNNFYGTQYNSRIMVVSNQLPQRPKVYNNISVEANIKPIFVYFYNDYPYLQTSDLEDVDFRDLEGVYYATLYRNKIIDNGSGTYQTTALLTGEKMRNVAMKIMLEFDVTEVPLELKFLNIGYDISKGHTT
jgi:hypothetical protein